MKKNVPINYDMTEEIKSEYVNECNAVKINGKVFIMIELSTDAVCIRGEDAKEIYYILGTNIYGYRVERGNRIVFGEKYSSNMVKRNVKTVPFPVLKAEIGILPLKRIEAEVFKK